MSTTTTTEKPILFSTELVQAILDGRKTQTRRVIKSRVNELPEYYESFGLQAAKDITFEPQPSPGLYALFGNTEADDWIEPIKSPYGQPGDQLWVRETWKSVSYSEHGWIIKYRADESTQEIERLFPLEQNDKEIHWAEKTCQEFEQKDNIGWKPSIYMPRLASRIQLTVEDIRVERVQEITEEDAKAEGIGPHESLSIEGGYAPKFARLWDEINADRGYSWESNPFVWVVEFSVKNIKG